MKIECLVFLLLAASCSAQLQEIKTQNVPYGGMAQQYAVIQVINDHGENYNIPCTDCVAYADIYDLANNNIQSGNMTEMKSGLFGIRLDPQYRVNSTYSMRATICSSSMNRTGIADSYLTIMPKSAQADMPVTGDGPTGIGTVDDVISAIGKGFSNALKPITDPINALISGLSPLWDFLAWGIGGFKDLFDFSLPLVSTMLNWALDNAKAFINDPIQTSYDDAWNVIMLLAGSVFLVFGPVIIAINLIGAAKNAQEKDPLAFLWNMGKYNIAAWGTIFGVFWRVGQIFTGTIQWIRNVKTGTIGDVI